MKPREDWVGEIVADFLRARHPRGVTVGEVRYLRWSLQSRATVEQVRQAFERLVGAGLAEVVDVPAVIGSAGVYGTRKAMRAYVATGRLLARGRGQAP